MSQELAVAPTRTTKTTWHAKIALQRLTNAVLTLPCKICGDSCAHGIEEIRCFLGPATSHFGRQNNQTGSSSVSFTLQTACNATQLVVAACRRAVPSHAGETLRWCPRPTVPRACGTQPINDDLNAPSIQWVESSQIQVMDEPVQTHTSACLPAHLSSRTLHKETSATQHPALEHAARWWPYMSSRRPHRQVREDTGSPGMVVGRYESHGWWATRSVLLKPTGYCDLTNARAGSVGGPHLSPEVSFFQTSGSPMLPSSLRLNGVCFWLQHWWHASQTPASLRQNIEGS